MSLIKTGIALTIAGGVSSAIGQYKQGKAARATAAANADMAIRNAHQEFWLSKIRSKYQEQAAGYELALAQSRAGASRANARAASNEAKAIAERGREQGGRMRDESMEVQAGNDGVYAGNGLVTNTGTPLAVRAQTAMKAELAIQDMHYMANVDRTRKLFERDMLNLEAEQAEFAGVAQYALAKAESRLSGIASMISFRNSLADAEITRATGAQAASNANIAAISTGFSTFSNAAQMYYTSRKPGTS